MPRSGAGSGNPAQEEEIERNMPFSCSICGEESTRICVRCTKDACDNHLCEKCRKCSDCCECEVALAPRAPESVREALHAAVANAGVVATETAMVAESAAAEPVAETPPVPESPPEVVTETPAEPAAVEPVAEALADPAPGPEESEPAAS